MAAEAPTKGKIVVTGFGPFGNHAINASWVSVKLLPKEIEGFEIITEEIPVAYDIVDKRVQKLWEEHKPALVIHVGVSQFADKITIETCAHKEGYDKKDCFGNNPMCSANSEETCIEIGINAKDICDNLNENTSIKACVSTNAGRYLCEYIFYTSLCIDKHKTMFLHVPCLEKPYSAQELAVGITEVIRYALKQCHPLK